MAGGALDGDLHAIEVALAQAALGADLDAAEHALGRHRRGIARSRLAFRQTDHVFGGAAHGHHVVRADADVFRRDVGAVQAGHGATEGLEQGLTVKGAFRLHDHGLAAADRQVGHDVLVAHALGQAEHVGQGRFGIGIGPHAATAAGRAAGRRMHTDDGLQAGDFVGREKDFLVIVERRVLENAHYGLTLCNSDGGPWTAGSGRGNTLSRACRQARENTPNRGYGNNSSMRHRSMGRIFSSNHGFLRIQALFRHDGCGSGRNSGPKSAA